MIEKLVSRKYLPEFVYGGIDGIITTFAVVSAAIGASLSPLIVIIMGLANIFADGFSVAISEVLAFQSEAELHRHRPDAMIFERREKHPLKIGLSTFFSFALMGFVPLLPFVLATVSPAFEANKILYSVILTAVALALVGAIKGKLVRKHPLEASLETLLLGGIAAILAFLVGYFLKGFVI